MAIVDACGISKGYFRTMDDFKNCITCGIPNEIIIREKIISYEMAIDDCLKIINECSWKDAEMLSELIAELKEFKYSTD